MNKKEELIRNSLILLLGAFGTKLINFIMLPFYTKWLSVDDYGIIDILTVLISCVVPILTLQLEQAMFRFLIDDNAQEDQRKIISSGAFCIGAVMLILNFVALIASLIYINQYWFALVISMDFQCILTVLLQIARGKGKNNYYAIDSIIVAVVNVIIASILVRYFKMGVTGYFIAYCISQFTGILYLTYTLSLMHFIKIGSFELKKLKIMLRFSVPLIFNNISWWVLNASDKLIINTFLGVNANGLYAAAGKVPSIITIIFSVFQLAWQESASRSNKEKDKEKFYSDVFEVLIPFMCFITVGLLLGSKLTFTVFINNKFLAAYCYVPILIVSILFYCISQYYGGLYIGLKFSKALGNSSIMAAALNFIINIIFVKSIGVWAACASTLVAYAFLMVYRIIDIKKYYQLEYNYKSIFFNLIIVMFAFSMTYILNIHEQLLMLIIITTLYALIYRKFLLNIYVKSVKRIRAYKLIKDI